MGARRMDIFKRIYIPENEYGIKEDYYDVNGIVELLRDHCTEPETIRFIADMLEE